MSKQLKLRWGAAMWAAVCFMQSQPLIAGENGLNHYPIGASTIGPGFLPPPGDISFTSYSQYYSADRLNGPGGASLDPNFGIKVWAEAPRVVYTWEPMLGPFSVSSQLLLPITRVQIEAFGHRDTSTGLSDLLVAPFNLGYVNSTSTLHVKLGLDTYAPIGKYDEHRLANNGLNYWTFSPNIALTWLPSPRWEISGAAFLEFNTTNPATDYHSGNAFAFDGDIGYYPLEEAPKLKLAVQGSAYVQYTDDEIGGSKVSGGNRGRTFSLGPQISWDIGRGGGVLFKYQKEFGVRNRPDGDRYWVQVAIPF